MPEGHTIHRIARDHQRLFAGQTLAVSSPQGRFRGGARELDGRMLNRVEARGKHLFYDWGGALLHLHLGLYGKFRRHSCPPPAPQGAVRLRVVGDEHAFDLNGPSACELIDRSRLAAIHGRLGPDPLGRHVDADQAWRRIRQSRSAIGKLLLDQSVFAGVGNVYRAEVLFILRIHPDRPGNCVSHTEFHALWKTLVELMRIGVKYNRIITADPATVGRPRGRMRRDERLLIYKKPDCPQCGSPVRSWSLGARTIYACGRCQV